MNQPFPAEPVSRYQDDEVDLVRLFAIIWAGKWLVAGAISLTFLASALWLSQKPKVFRVSAGFVIASEIELRYLHVVLGGGALSEFAEQAKSLINDKGFQERVLAENLPLSIRKSNKLYTVSIDTLNPQRVAGQLNQLLEAVSGEAVERFKGAYIELLGGQVSALEQQLKSDFVRLAEPTARAELQKGLVLLKARVSQLQMVDGFKGINIVKPAVEPVTPISPRPKLIWTVSIVLGGILGLFVVFIRHAVKNYRARQE
ncbi:hypothetical protein [Maricurvus nonylphenolicus]|uniref:hypothetical protein n=1 Tax=Maricurvus nonylphenolicus TaxID=1008307 RepID=UPI0036F333A2